MGDCGLQNRPRSPGRIAGASRAKARGAAPPLCARAGIAHRPARQGAAGGAVEPPRGGAGVKGTRLRHKCRKLLLLLTQIFTDSKIRV